MTLSPVHPHTPVAPIQFAGMYCSRMGVVIGKDTKDTFASRKVELNTLLQTPLGSSQKQRYNHLDLLRLASYEEAAIGLWNRIAEDGYMPPEGYLHTKRLLKSVPDELKADSQNGLDALEAAELIKRAEITDILEGEVEDLPDNLPPLLYITDLGLQTLEDNLWYRRLWRHISNRNN